MNEIEHLIEKGEIDEDMIPLIRALNQLGIKTTECCSGHGRIDAYVAIDMDSLHDVAVRCKKEGTSMKKLVIWWQYKNKEPKNRSW